MGQVGTHLKEHSFPIKTVQSIWKSDKNWLRYGILKIFIKAIFSNIPIVNLSQNCQKIFFCKILRRAVEKVYYTHYVKFLHEYLKNSAFYSRKTSENEQNCKYLKSWFSKS